MKFCVEKKHINTVHFIVDPSEMNVFGGSNGGATGGYHQETKEMQIHENHYCHQFLEGVHLGWLLFSPSAQDELWLCRTALQ